MIREVETDKVRDRLFVRIDSKDQEENKALGLVVNPEILQILFVQARQFDPERKVCASIYSVGIVKRASGDIWQ